MKFRKMAFVVAIVMLFSAAPFALRAENIETLITRVPGKNFKYDNRKVEVMEFISFYCSHCYSFESEIPKIKGTFPRKISWRVYPIYWGTGSSKPGEAYLLALDEGKGDQMKKAIFDAIFRDKADIGDVTVLESLGRKIGLGFDFSRKLRSGVKADEAQAVLSMAKDYNVSSTPTVIVAGNMSVNPVHDLDEFRGNVIRVIKSVLKK